MALNPFAHYPGQLSNADPTGYPYGSAQNVVVEGDGSGTPYEKDIVNDNLGFQQALLKEASITPSGTPDKVGASQYLDAVKAIAAEIARDTIAPAALQDWRAQGLPSGPDYRFLLTSTVPDRPDAIVALGITSGDARFVRSLGSGQFEALEQNWGSAVGPFFAASGALGTFFFNNSNELVRHTDLQTQNVHSGATNVEAFFYAAGSPTPYMYFTSDAQIYKSASFDTGYSAAARPGSMTVFASSTSGVPGGEFAYDGANDICYNSVMTIGGVTRSRVLRSVDGGTTWTLAFTADAGVSLSICHSEAAGGFVILDSNGNLYFEDDAFAVAVPTPITAAAGASDNYSTFAACGEVIAKVFDALLFSGTCSQAGIAYSFDFGSTWKYASVSDELAFGSSEGLLRLISANGRLWGLGANKVYMSGQIAFD